MRILVFGDSITQGFHDEIGGGWCNRLISHVMSRDVVTEYAYNKSVLNLGVSGDTTEDLLKRIQSESEARLLNYPSDGDVLLLAIGINDSQFDMQTKENKIPVEQSIKNFALIEKETEGLFQEIVIVGITPVFDNKIQPMSWKPTHGYSNEEIERYNLAIAKYAEDNGHHYIEMKDVYDGDIESCLPDGLHPNAAGHSLIYEKVKSELEKEDIL